MSIMTKLQISYFLAVAAHGGFAAASRVLYVSQPTLTQQVASLEKELGFRLLVRRHHSIELTEEGRLMYECFSRFDADFNACYDKARKLQSGDSGELRVGMLVMAHLPQTIQSLVSFCSGGRALRVSHGHLAELGDGLSRGEIDLALMFDDLAAAYPDFISAPLFPAEYLIVLSADDPLAKKGRVSVSELSGKTFFVSTQPDFPAVLQEQARVFHTLGLDRLSISRTTSLEAAYSMVSSGLGFAFGSEFSSMLDAQRFCLIPAGLSHSMCVVWNPNRLSSLARLCLEQVFGIDPEAGGSR